MRCLQGSRTSITGGLRATCGAPRRRHTGAITRALAKLTHEAEGEPRFVSDPPLLVPSPRADGVGVDVEINAPFRDYIRTLPADLRALLDRFTPTGFARRVVGDRQRRNRLLGDVAARRSTAGGWSKASD
jgi:Uncharacterized protein conserved in bacteria (DUF2252)